MSMEAPDPINILLVDDQPAKLLSYEVILEELGEVLLKASSARDALAQLLKYDVAVVLIDVQMPELDGYELASMNSRTSALSANPIDLCLGDLFVRFRSGQGLCGGRR